MLETGDKLRLAGWDALVLVVLGLEGLLLWRAYPLPDDQAIALVIGVHAGACIVHLSVYFVWRGVQELFGGRSMPGG
jgi:hypothetical protein